MVVADGLMWFVTKWVAVGAAVAIVFVVFGGEMGWGSMGGFFGFFMVVEIDGKKWRTAMTTAACSGCEGG